MTPQEHKIGSSLKPKVRSPGRRLNSGLLPTTAAEARVDSHPASEWLLTVDGCNQPRVARPLCGDWRTRPHGVSLEVSHF